MQEGTIEIDSKLEKGTSCKITIDDKVSKPAVAEFYDLKGKTILVVEDNAINQMVIKMITKKWLNTSVLYANNGQEGIETIKCNKIDVVLMDLQMPVMDGYEAAQAIREGAAGSKNKNIPIIAVTADVMETTKERIAKIEMNNYITKPIEKEALFKMVKELVF